MSQGRPRAGVLGRLDAGKWLARLRQPTHRPTDVLNVIDYADFRSYRWYAVMVYPTVLLMGGRAVWGGKWRRALIGERWAKSITVMRYPSHRVWMLMISNPYYLVINGLRDRGVERFEASFTNPFVQGDDLKDTECALGAHFSSSDASAGVDRVLDVLAPHGARLAYASHVFGEIDFLRDPGPSDPNPLRHRVTALFSVPRAAVDAIHGDPRLAALERELPGICLHLYERSSFQDYVPFTKVPE